MGKTISSVSIYLDDNVPDYMDGIIRVGSCIIDYSDGTSFDNQDVVDNTEYHSDDELIEDIAKRLGCSSDNIEIQQNHNSLDCVISQ